MTASHRLVALVAAAALVATAALVAGVGAVAGAPAAAAGPLPAGTTTDTVPARSAVAQANGTATFDDTIVTAERGDTVALTVVFEGTDRARLSLGNEVELNYVLNVTVEDGNGDGRTVVLLDLELAGLEADPVSTASTADSVTVTHESFVGDSIEPSEYPMTLSVGGVDTGVATLIVQEQRTPPDETTPTATPGPDADLDPATVRVVEGGTADLAVQFDDSDEMTLSVTGGENVSYDLRATLRDDNDDGRVPLTFDASSAGGDGATLTARDAADSVTVTSEADLDDLLPAGEYDLRLRSGSGASEPIVVTGRLVVERPATNGTATGSPAVSVPTDPAIVVLVGVAVGGLGVAVGSRLVAE